MSRPRRHQRAKHSGKSLSSARGHCQPAAPGTSADRTKLQEAKICCCTFITGPSMGPVQNFAPSVLYLAQTSGFPPWRGSRPIRHDLCSWLGMMGLVHRMGHEPAVRRLLFTQPLPGGCFLRLTSRTELENKALAAGEGGEVKGLLCLQVPGGW